MPHALLIALVAFLLGCSDAPASPSEATNTAPVADLAPAPPSAADTLGYETYTNARFGYSVPYPPDLLTPRPEATNGDGRRFVASDSSAVLTVYGALDALEEGLDGLRDRRIADLDTSAVQAQTDSSFTVSGTRDGWTVWMKGVMLDAERYAVAELAYDPARHEVFEVVTEEIDGRFP